MNKEDGDPIYAHSRSDTGPDLWEKLPDHAAAVAPRAARNADSFGAASLAEIAGWLHDLGKLKPDFQRKLTGAIVEVSHSGEGARGADAVYPAVLHSDAVFGTGGCRFH